VDMASRKYVASLRSYECCSRLYVSFNVAFTVLYGEIPAFEASTC
jgi:hypothetical protein